METQIYLKVYSATGVVRKADARKMTKLYKYVLRNGVVVIPVASKEIALMKLNEISKKKYSKHYNFIIDKKIFTTECEKQIVKTKVIDNGSVN